MENGSGENCPRLDSCLGSVFFFFPTFRGCFLCSLRILVEDEIVLFLHCSGKWNLIFTGGF